MMILTDIIPGPCPSYSLGMDHIRSIEGREEERRRGRGVENGKTETERELRYMVLEEIKRNIMAHIPLPQHLYHKACSK